MSKAAAPARKAVFLGSKRLGLNVFRALHGQAPGLDWTLVHPDDAADGRGILPDFAQYAKEQDLELIVVASASETKAALREIRPEIGMACGWYWLLDAEALSLIPGGLWGVHNSLLPKYRGGSPLVWSIINGDEFVGATVFKISPGMDDGPILLRTPVRLEDSDTIAEVLDKMQAKIVAELPAKWTEFLNAEAQPEAQDESQATYCGQRAPEDGLIDWRCEARVVHNFVRAQAPPYPGAFSYIDGRKVTVLSTAVLDVIYYGTPGQVLRRTPNSVVVCCGQNTALALQRVAIEGVEQSPGKAIKSLRLRFTDAPADRR